MSNPRYSVGIDLGTTHCVLSYLDLHSAEEQALPTVLAIPQLIEPGVIEARQQLASFVYLPHAVEIAEGFSTLPWTAKAEYLLGDVARFLGAKTPIRLVSSAKSWLGHK
ncbi:MAG: Hsp70 family protein, partial [Methylococcaceae bacterium]|nr:Hsp70 family protein [Methylococcaceae bacterium]